MAGRIPQAFIDELLVRTDIVEVVGSRVQLKKAGREWKAPCPFHNEKTPSFWVSPDKQFYHCFGCGAHGTALGFLMEHDRLPFPEAVEELASRLGMEVPHDESRGGSRPQDDLHGLLGEVTQFYREALRESPQARDYLDSRGITSESRVRYAIGYAPDAWDAVLKRFGGNPEAVQRLTEVGLIIERSGGRESGHYDRFRDRIMFPIRDIRGRTVGFGGRTLGAGEPKYLNSPETPLFHKGRELYGLYEARQSLRQIDRLMVVEGYVDVVRLAQAGIQYAVATLGTATTTEHLSRLFRVTNELVFCFDGDRAGRTAAWRALENALPHARDGRQLRFLFLPDGQDPDSLVGEEGREAFEARLAHAVPLSEFLVGQLASQVDLGSVDGRARLAELTRPLLARVPEGVYRALLLERLAEGVRMPANRLQDLLGTTSPGSTGRGARPRRTESASLAGRKPLLTQAITLVLHHPAAAAAVADPGPLRDAGLRGGDVLAELIEMARSDPGLSTARLVERWRERPEGARLAELAATESLVGNDKRAAAELVRAVERLLSETGPQRRLDELIEASRERRLSAEEQQEFQVLLTQGQRRGH
ncbi:MAG: DNA primase [Steroidobacteraceae bacterium]